MGFYVHTQNESYKGSLYANASGMHEKLVDYNEASFVQLFESISHCSVDAQPTVAKAQDTAA